MRTVLARALPARVCERVVDRRRRRDARMRSARRDLPDATPPDAPPNHTRESTASTKFRFKRKRRLQVRTMFYQLS
eukprot:2928751-Pleurochrysis_carterae.AAC.5